MGPKGRASQWRASAFSEEYRKAGEFKGSGRGDLLWGRHQNSPGTEEMGELENTQWRMTRRLTVKEPEALSPGEGKVCMGFNGWLQIFEELTCRGSRHPWEWEEQLMEIAGGRFHVNIRQNFLTLTVERWVALPWVVSRSYRTVTCLGCCRQQSVSEQSWTLVISKALSTSTAEFYRHVTHLI